MVEIVNIQGDYSELTSFAAHLILNLGLSNFIHMIFDFDVI